MSVAKTILEQLKALTHQSVFWSWGASKFQAVSQNQIEGVGEDYLGGLVFYVRGMKHKGHVFVTLNLSDTYTISIGHLRKGKFNVKKQVKDVFFDQMSSTIDGLIEKQDNYSF